MLAEKTGMGRTWIGLVLLATVTSLPELATSASAVTVAAVEPAGGRPWSLVFRRAGMGWRLAAAAPVE